MSIHQNTYHYQLTDAEKLWIADHRENLVRDRAHSAALATGCERVSIMDGKTVVYSFDVPRHRKVKKVVEERVRYDDDEE